MIKRPTTREIIKKIRQAKRILREKNGLFVAHEKLYGELEELDIIDSKDIWKLILELLEEIHPDDYAGGYPPFRSYEDKIIGQDLFAFSWESKILLKRMYLKFAIKGDDFYYVSLHQDKRKK